MSAWLRIVAGPNGAGKSTFVEEQVEVVSGLAVNPDAIAREIAIERFSNQLPALDPRELQRQAVRRSDALVDECIATKRTIVVETVLSSDKCRDRLTAAHAAGMKVSLTYVALSSPEIAVARVTTRVGVGGHLVPPDDIVRRYPLSLDNLAWFASRVDELRVFCNDEVPTIVAYREEGGPIFVSATCPDVVKRCFSALRHDWF